MSHKNLSVKIKIPKLLKNYLNNKKIKKIYNKFEKSLNINHNFIVGVSGGPDSLALAYLAKIYSIKKNIKAKFYIVDHRLRKESHNEAILVKKILQKSLINSQILTWKGKKPTKNIQSMARRKRYELLINECKKLNINNILIGHHEGDFFENFFMRILRGSGLKGLVSFDKKTKIENIGLLRPLLDQKKNDLIFLSKKVFNYYVQDPTNLDEKYQRTKIRSIIEKFQENGLDNKKLFLTIKNLQHSNLVVDFYVDKNLRENTFFDEKKNRIIMNRSFFIQPYEVIFRAFSDTIKLVGKKYYPVRGKKLEKIIKDIENNSLFRATLGGCIIEKVNQTVIISKEY